ncbi:glycerophosphodiester phosphodiesterase [Nonomuraea sp. WAC 01424]|uniref:glycerophosphodiester phosphodiesterase n=1 Tax=Nonomuraea sp. WAC 01424 TaxID=2203200 RepID=UPI000F77819A|nr:glycerophosphodiester phosphodiesterase family protein [Nonomuraea sp. WAC 01424]RSN04198.1 glycerophosphodiester phosphodiesterase [Nonomuraea sp. WAC 01424]
MFRRLALFLPLALLPLASPPATASATASTTVVNVAHRGASAYAPENTIAAFQLAARQGADMFELDVQETKDHELVLMHDTTLARTTDAERVLPGLAPWRVRDLTLAQIRRLDAGSWFDREYTGERVPTLREALRAMAGTGLGLLLEVKEPRLYPDIESRVVRALRDEPAWLVPGRLVAQSFDWDSMRAFHRLLPEVPIGLLGTPDTAALPDLAKFANHVNPPYTALTSSYVKRAHELGMKVFTWTVDSPDIMRRLLTYNVDGIITDKPDVLRDLSL